MRNALLAAGLGLIAASVAGAEERKDTLSVRGVGSVSVPADQLHLDFLLTSAAEDAATAETGLANRAKAYVEAFELELRPAAPVTSFSVFIRLGSVRVGQAAQYDYSGKLLGNSEATFTRDVSIQFLNIRKMPRLVFQKRLAKVLRDFCDISDTPNSADCSKLLIHFELDDQEAGIALANEKAIASAKKQAAGLASIAGRKLGKVVDIKSDIRIPLNEDPFARLTQLASNLSDTSSRSADVAIESRVFVEFELEDR